MLTQNFKVANHLEGAYDLLTIRLLLWAHKALPSLPNPRLLVLYLSSSSAGLEKPTEPCSSPIPGKQILVCVMLFSSCCIWLQTQINPAQLGYVLCKTVVRSQYFPYGFLLKEYLVETFLVGGASINSFVLGTSTWILCSVPERTFSELICTQCLQCACRR